MKHRKCSEEKANRNIVSFRYMRSQSDEWQCFALNDNLILNTIMKPEAGEKGQEMYSSKKSVINEIFKQKISERNT